MLTCIGNIIGAIWAAPLTVLGLVAGLLGWTRPLGIHGAAAWFEAKPGGICALFFARSGMAAFTWGQVIVVWNRAALVDGQLARHELRHVLQGMVLGPLNPIAYALGALWGWLRWGSPYLCNPLEVDARRHANEE